MPHFDVYNLTKGDIMRQRIGWLVARHRKPLQIWLYLALFSLILDALLWLTFVPRDPIWYWSWLTLKIMLSWGVPVLAWISGRELLWWLECSTEQKIASIEERHPIRRQR